MTASVATLAIALLLAATSCDSEGTGAERARPDAHGLAQNPPTATQLALRVAGASATRAEVTACFAPDPRLSSTLLLDGEHGPVTLEASQGDCPQGSRSYSGTVPFDAAALVARQEALDRLADRVGHPLERPEFVGRALTGNAKLTHLNVQDILAGKRVVLNGIWATPDEIIADRSLLITDTTVVGDLTRTGNPCVTGGAPLGKWSFGYLMQQIAGPTNAATMTRNWLAKWESAQTVNGLTVDARGLIRRTIIDPWQTASGGATQPLDLSKAPFRLLAIVNRIDLADSLAYGAGNGGELRFVFGALSAPPACTPLSFTVIFEFAVPRAGCKSLREWARAWVDLGLLTPGSSAYETALEALTEEVVPAGAGPGRPNGSNLAQIRTNEIALLDLQAHPGQQLWEEREFHLDKLGALAQTTVRRTPRPDVDQTATLSSWANPNASAIVDDDYEIPDQFPSPTPFAGGNALADKTTFWDATTAAPITDADARHHLSLNTCNGCHARETGTDFTHVSPTGPLGQPAQLSGFLKGITVTDPANASISYTFNDLDRRRTVLADMANNPCIFMIFQAPLHMAH
jgi:hypothetical protein